LWYGGDDEDDLWAQKKINIPQTLLWSMVTFTSVDLHGAAVMQTVGLNVEFQLYCKLIGVYGPDSDLACIFHENGKIV